MAPEEQALQTLDQLAAMAPVSRAAHMQGIQAVELLRPAILRDKAAQEAAAKPKS